MNVYYILLCPLFPLSLSLCSSLSSSFHFAMLRAAAIKPKATFFNTSSNEKKVKIRWADHRDAEMWSELNEKIAAGGDFFLDKWKTVYWKRNKGDKYTPNERKLSERKKRTKWKEKWRTKRRKGKKRNKNIVLYLLYYIWIGILCRRHWVHETEHMPCHTKATHNGM